MDPVSEVAELVARMRSSSWYVTTRELCKALHGHTNPRSPEFCRVGRALRVLEELGRVRSMRYDRYPPRLGCPGGPGYWRLL